MTSTPSMEILERETGTIPISIGTALAFEALFGIHPSQPEHDVNPKTIKEVWINLRTLVRNLYSAVSTADKASINLNDAITMLVDESKLLPFILTQYSFKSKVIFYTSDMESIKWSFPKAAYKEAKTPKQIAYKFFEDYVTSGLYDGLIANDIPVMVINKAPNRILSNVAMLTHLPHELLWRDQFDRLILLESHTGRLKPYNLWYTKLNGVGNNGTPIPFNRYTLQVFGDGVFLDGQPRAIKAQLKQLAETRKWTPVTTPDKFYHDITTYGTKELVDNYRTLR